jgi:hypothetical protein
MPDKAIPALACDELFFDVLAGVANMVRSEVEVQRAVRTAIASGGGAGFAAGASSFVVLNDIVVIHCNRASAIPARSGPKQDIAVPEGERAI